MLRRYFFYQEVFDVKPHKKAMFFCLCIQKNYTLRKILTSCAMCVEKNIKVYYNYFMGIHTDPLKDIF